MLCQFFFYQLHQDENNNDSNNQDQRNLLDTNPSQTETV